MKKIDNLYVVAAISAPSFDNKKKYYNIFASTYVLDNIGFLSNEIELNRLELILLKNMYIIFVTFDSFEKEELKFHEIYTSNNKTIQVISISHKKLFNEGFLKKLMLNKEIKSNYFQNDIIFIFEGYIWSSIVGFFRWNNFIVSGGSNTKRHMLSPVQLRLSRFLIAFQLDVPDTFHSENKLYTRVGLDFTTKLVEKIFTESKKEQIINNKNININNNNDNNSNNNKLNTNEEINKFEGNNISLNKNKNILNNNLFNTKIQKREFHTSNIIRSNNEDEINKSSEILNFFNQTVYNKIENKINEELYGFNLSEEKKEELTWNFIQKLSKILSQELWKREQRKTFPTIHNSCLEFIKLVDEYSILDVYIENNKDESIETICDDEINLNIMIKQLQDKINYEFKEKTDLRDDEFKKLFTVIWNNTYETLKEKKVETKYIVDEFNKIISEIDSRKEYKKLNKFKNNDNNNLTPRIKFKAKGNIINKKNYSINNYIQKRDLHNTLNVFKITDNIENLISNKKFTKNLETTLYKSINDIIIRNDLNDIEKQFEIELIYINILKKKIDENLTNPNFLNSNEGLKLLNKAVKELDENLNLFKTPKFLKNKKYGWVIANLSNSLIISTTLSILIPIIYKNSNLFDQNYQNLLYKLGKNLYRNYLTEHYFNYLKIYNELKNDLKKNNVKNKTIDYKIIDNLTNNEIVICIDGTQDKKEYGDFINKICFSEILDEYFYDIGHDILQFINLTTDYIKVEAININKTNKTTVILPGENFENLLDISFMDISALPMICKPNDWVVSLISNQKIDEEIKIKDDISLNFSNKDIKQIKLNYKIIKFGGYLKNNLEHNQFIHKNPINAGKLKLINLDIIKTINYIQSVPFIINLNVLEHILNWIVVNKNLEDPLFFNKHEETNIFNEHKTNKNLFKVNEILRHNSLYRINLEVINSAILLRYKTFYNPIFSDWRGRIYTNNTILSFQGNELNRSLLYFKNGNILDKKGLEALKIYTANVFGLNKLSNNYKIKWINNNIEKIIELNNDLINDAKEKLLFIACAYELKGYYNDPDNFISRLPVYLDATASGLQHLSVMTKDLNLAKYVNILKSNEDEIPNDIYIEMSKKVSEIINKICDSNPNSEIKKLLINNNRDFVKWAIMTTSYGVTIRGIKDQLIDKIFIKTNDKYRYIVNINEQKIEKVSNLYKLKEIKFLKEEYRSEFENFTLKGTEIMFLAKLIHNTLYDTYPSLSLLVKYFNDINDFLNLISLEIGIIWQTPSGLILEQKYLETISEVKSRYIKGHRKTYSISKTISKVNKLKQKRGLMPNLIKIVQ
jgi:DNA-dependent RNA polymerase-like protein